MKATPMRGISIFAAASIALASIGCASPGTPERARDTQCLAPPAELTIKGAHAAMRRGELTAEGLVTAYLDRIAALDQPSRMNAIRTIDPGAIETARALDREFAKSGELKPLHGIPVMRVAALPTASVRSPLRKSDARTRSGGWS
jgi:hypothetical protein